MFSDDIGLHLAGAAADRGRETIEIGALPETALARLVVADVQAPSAPCRLIASWRMRRVISVARSLCDRGREPG